MKIPILQRWAIGENLQFLTDICDNAGEMLSGISISESLMEKFGKIVRVMRNTFFKRSAALLLASTILFANANVLWELQHISNRAICPNDKHYRSFFGARSMRVAYCTSLYWTYYLLAYCDARKEFKKCKDDAWDFCMANVPDDVTDPIAGAGGFLGAGLGFAAGGAATDGNPVGAWGGGAVGAAAGIHAGNVAAKVAYCQLNADYRADRAECKRISNEKINGARDYRNRLVASRLADTFDGYSPQRQYGVPFNGICNLCDELNYQRTGINHY